MVICPFVLFPLTIVLSVLRYTDSDYPFGIFKLFLKLFVNKSVAGLVVWNENATKYKKLLWNLRNNHDTTHVMIRLSYSNAKKTITEAEDKTKPATRI
jgi:hypothetical protein